LKKYF